MELSYRKTVDEIAETSDLAILPVGSLEQHGHHLPVITDTVVSQAFADAVGERLNAYVLPCLPITNAAEHKGKRGTVWIKPDTLYHVLRDIILNLRDQGFCRVVVIKGHGGLATMDPAIRYLNEEHSPGLRVCMLEPVFREALSGILQSPGELHAGELETSFMLYLRPELVKMERAVDFEPDVPRQYLNYGSIFNYAPDGVWGRPSLATAEKGERCFEICVDKSVEYITKIFSMMENRRYGG